MANGRVLAPNQRSQIWLGGPELPEPTLVFESDEILVEAPNWSLDGRSLLVNGDGLLFRLDLGATRPSLEQVEFAGLPPINNDHVLDPDGEHIYLSAADRHIYRGALAGGEVTRVSPDDGRWHFLHGVSPDGKRLAYVEISEFSSPGRLAVVTPGAATATIVDTGDAHIDGPEWSPDGAWIYFNTEGFTTTPGHAQLARIADAGGPVEQLVASDTVDWFPHLSSDARLAAYIAFPAGTLGHPADLDVDVRLVSVDDWSTPIRHYPLFGGQGTINVNSWAPDSTRFAFAAYPIG
ncbi:TolB family protein [Flindersiella endophytica]